MTAGDLNTHLRDNLNALKAPPTDHYEANEASNYTTTSTSFADVDGTNLALTITTSGGDVLVHFHGTVGCSTSSSVCFNVAVDGADDAAEDGYLVYHGDGVGSYPISFTRLITGLSADEHTFKLRWKVYSGTATLYAGAGTSQYDIHPQFWVREAS